MSKLHDIFIDLYGEEVLRENAAEAEKKVKALILELIEDEPFLDWDNNPYDELHKRLNVSIAIRNSLREELRERVKEL